MNFTLPDLPFPPDALAPHMSAETLQYHHGKHHAGYVRKLNQAVEGTGLANLSLEEIILKTADEAEHTGVFNNAAQVWNHSFFWHCLSPKGGGKPDGELSRQIDEDFGSFDTFREAFLDAATGQFGSGWAWLVSEAGKLKVVSTANAVTPMVNGQQALLTCDVWEHAYYLDYQNKRSRFVENFLDHLVNWEFVNEQFQLPGEGASSPVSAPTKQQG